MDKLEIYKRILSNIEIKPSPDGRFQDCWYWKKSTRSGYGRIKIEKKSYSTHRISAYINNILDPNGFEFTLDSPYKICHKCDNKLCNNSDHLFVGTMLDNHKDRNNKNRQAKGVKIHLAKLDEQDVIEIRENKENFTKKELSEIYETNLSTIKRVISRKTWKHL